MEASPFGDRSYIISDDGDEEVRFLEAFPTARGRCDALVALAIGVVACGTDTTTPVDPPAATPTPTAVPTPTAGAATPAEEPDAAPALTGWRTDLVTGPNVGDVAPNPSVLLRDGSMATLEEVAAGKPMVLYFFATW